MEGYDLPTSAEIGGREYAIRSDYRAALDMIDVMCDIEITDEERTVLVLSIFYPEFDEMPLSDFQEAVDYANWFVSGGERQDGKKRPKLMDWRQDFPLIVAPVNRILGCEVRSVDYLHWWTFLAAYREVGDCLFAHVVSVRKKRLAGKKLDKQDEQFYRENVSLVELRSRETEAESKVFDEWIGGGDG